MLIISVLLLALASVEAVVNQPFSPGEDASPFCGLPPYQDPSSTFTVKAGMCVGDGNDGVQILGTAQIQEMAEIYAPYLFFHPLETFTMSAVNRTFGDASQGKIYTSFGGERTLVDKTLNLTRLMMTTRDRDEVMFSNKFFFEHAMDLSYKDGDGFDENGISRAPIYYRAFDSGNSTITINYFFYFTWNGPAGLALISSVNGTNQYVPFQQFPYGVHEGDWESMSVTVCAGYSPERSPLAVTYRQRSYGQVLDCTSGGCFFFNNTLTHPVGFVALSNHAVYPQTVSEMVYAEVETLEFYVNLQKILIVDRLSFEDKNGTFRYFRPNGTNVLRLAEQDEIPDLVDESDFWGAFGGRWGRAEDDLFANLTNNYPTCLDFGSTQRVPCPTPEENPVFHMVMQMLGVNETETLLMEAARGITGFLGDFFADAASPPGPATSSFYSRLESPGNARVWNKMDSNVSHHEFAENYCNDLQDIPDTFRLPVDTDSVPFVKNSIGVATMLISFALFNVVYALCRKFTKVVPVILQDDEGNYVKPTMRTHYWVFQFAVNFTWAYLGAFAGGVLFFLGYERLLGLAEAVFDIFNGDYVSLMVIIVGSFNLATNTLMLVSVWVTSLDLWLKINRKYCALVGDAEGAEQYTWDKQPPWRRFLKEKVHHGDRRLSILLGSLIIGLVLSAFLVTIGVYNVGLAYAMGTICRALVGSLDGHCFSWHGWGEEILCGSDFQAFCKDWARTEMMLTLWGCFVVFVGNYYIVLFSFMADRNRVSANRALASFAEQQQQQLGPPQQQQQRTNDPQDGDESVIEFDDDRGGESSLPLNTWSAESDKPGDAAATPNEKAEGVVVGEKEEDVGVGAGSDNQGSMDRTLQQ